MSLVVTALFALFWLGQTLTGEQVYNQERMAHGQPPVSVARFMGSAEFWFESSQNWQSEFLALASMVVLSIWLRQRGSPQSKPVDAPHDSTGPDLSGIKALRAARPGCETQFPHDMCTRADLLERYRMAVEQNAERAPLDYIQLRNQEALREWRIKLAFSKTCRPLPAKPRFTQRTRERMHALFE